MITIPNEQARLDTASSTSTGRLDRPVDRRHVYGHFLEPAFFGNIDGGVFDEGSPLSIAEPGPLPGCVRTCWSACRELGVPVCAGRAATSPRRTAGRTASARGTPGPRRLDLAWGGEESNRFGTDEFLAWCDAVGAEPYLVHCCRDVDEAVRWVEYTNYAGDTRYTRLRAANGHPEPYRVRYWGVGNEVYGPWQMGHRARRAVRRRPPASMPGSCAWSTRT